MREPIVLVLAALALVGALSAAWTLGAPARSLRWAGVTLGYAGVVIAAAIAARTRAGRGALVLGLGVLAGAALALGLAATALLERPYALRIGAVWRPAGPFEYPPALALLAVSALPLFLTTACARRGATAAGGTIGLVLVGGVLALSASRTALALGVAIAGIAVAAPALTVGAARIRAGAAVALAAAAGVALQLLLGGGRPPAAEPDPVAVAGAAALLLGAPPLWLVIRPGRAAPAVRSRAWRPVPGGVAVAGAAIAAGSLAFGAAAGRGAGAGSGFLHGREVTWRAGLEAFLDRPLHGAGADAFLAASVRHQDGGAIVFAHNLPLELAVELGVAGLLLVLALYWSIGRLAWAARGSPLLWLLGPAAAAFALVSLLDWPWHLAGAGAVWALATGGLLGVATSKRRAAGPGA